jgi:transcriptional regulator with XRE-family HTH domain
MADVEIDDATDPGMVRAGAAAAARRRELDISQRSLAADGIINAGALISFEKGRSWPRERTRARLEEVLQWPAGTIARLRQGGSTGVEPVRSVPTGTSVDGEASLIAQAVDTAANSLGGGIDALPAPDDVTFTPRVTAILADLRQLEGVATRAARIGKVTPALLKSLSTVRRQIEELTVRAVAADTATLGQRVYAARRRANLTLDEFAQAVGVTADVIAAVESERPPSADAAALIEALVGELGWR